MPDDLLVRMRGLRRRATLLGDRVVDDYRPFLNQHDKVTFFRLPSRPPSDAKDLGVTPTATALMALCASDSLHQFYITQTTTELSEKLSAVIQNLLQQHWTTASLRQNNAFTTAMVLRAIATLVGAEYVDRSALSLTRAMRVERHREPVSMAWFDGEPITDVDRAIGGLSVLEVCKHLVKQCPAGLSVQGYPPTAAIGYWLFDAVRTCSVAIDGDDSRKVAGWAVTSLRRLVSLLVADDQALTDPIEMAMAACLCGCLRRIAHSSDVVRAGTSGVIAGKNELLAAVRLFFQTQNDSGVWGKYFPLFHYPDAEANHCWHFEVLEAIVQEFPEILREEAVLDRIERSVGWLEANRLEYREQRQVYYGWNSGGDHATLRRGEPESWATGVVHMFLTRLALALSSAIRTSVLEKYRDRLKPINSKTTKHWEQYLDSTIEGLGSSRKTVKELLKIEILEPAEVDVKTQGIHDPGAGVSEPARLSPRFRLHGRRTALLFGPPGTSKTSVAEALARHLGWPFLELSPTDFLSGGMAGIYHQVNEIFEDLSDLYGVVILFDEMDALVQSRDESSTASSDTGAAQLDVTQKFLTTSMLPRLLELRKRARTIFFMATNHQRYFDPAVKRAGRFDLLIPMGPPSFEEKIRGFEQWSKPSESEVDREAALKKFKSFAKNKETRDRLERFTYGEMGAFFDYLRREHPSGNLARALKDQTVAQFEALVKSFASEWITLSERNSELWREFRNDMKAARIQ